MPALHRQWRLTGWRSRGKSTGVEPASSISTGSVGGSAGRNPSAGAGAEGLQHRVLAGLVRVGSDHFAADDSDSTGNPEGDGPAHQPLTLSVLGARKMPATKPAMPPSTCPVVSSSSASAVRFLRRSVTSSSYSPSLADSLRARSSSVSTPGPGSLRPPYEAPSDLRVHGSRGTPARAEAAISRLRTDAAEPGSAVRVLAVA